MNTRHSFFRISGTAMRLNAGNLLNYLQPHLSTKQEDSPENLLSGRAA